MVNRELLHEAYWGYLDGVIALIRKGVCANTKNDCNETPLYFACLQGHTDIVQFLLQNRFNRADVSLGLNPLTAAVSNGHHECCKLLLEHRANVHSTNSEGESPMSIAMRKHHYSIILLLLQHGAMPTTSLNDIALQLLEHAKAEHARAVQMLVDLNFINLTSDSIFWEAFGFAFKHGSIELAERMLSNDSYSKVDKLHPDAVYYSAKNNWPTILSKLFEKRVNINALTDGQTPLYAGCKEGHETVVLLLLNNGADPNVENELRVTASNEFLFPLQAAVQRRNVAICNMLLEKGAKLDKPGEPLLHIACGTATNEWKTETRSADQMLSTIRLLLRQGVDLNALSDKGDTAIYRACTGEQLEMVRILLEAGTDVNHTSSRHYPLIAACDAGNVELINLLISAGADMKCMNSSNETCLHVLINACSSTTNSQKPAVGVSKVAVVSAIKSLLEAGADINARCSQEETALYRASKARREDVVRLLLDAGAEVDGSSNRRPLYAACERDKREIVDLLLQHGADSNASSVSSCILALPGMTVSITTSSSLPICCAVHQGYAEIVKLLLKYGADVNKKDELGKSAMVYVVESFNPSQVLNPLSKETHFRFLKLLLLAGGDVNVSSGHDGLSPLHIASSAGMCDLMTELIQRGANCNQLTSNGTSCLDLACKNGHEAASEVLLQNGAKPDGKTGTACSSLRAHSSYETHAIPPLCMAAKNGSETMVNMLLKHGANVNASSEKGDTALHLATSYVVMETLLNAKANVNATNDNGETALSVVCEKRPSDANVVELLLKFGADPNIRYPLNSACKNNDMNIVKLLLAYGANANLATMSERLVFIPGLLGMRCKDVEPSALCTACKNGNVAIVDCLLNNGADAAFADINGDTALHFAVERLGERLGQQSNSEEYDPIVTLLLEHDAPINVVSSKGETPLYLACMKGLAGVIKQLLDCRADVGLTTTDKYPLLIACERKFRDVAMTLLDCGANPSVSTDKETPLKLALANGDAELIQQLLRCGADVNQMQGISDTALHVAVVHASKAVENKAYVDIVQRLLQSDAEPNALNHKRETPLFLACRPKFGDINVDIVQALLERGADPNVGLYLPYDRSISLPNYSTHDDDLPPLFAASRCGNTALVILLMKYGATVDSRTGLGRTALHYAIGYDKAFSRKSNTSTAEVLLSAGADANAVDKAGASPLYLACERGMTEFVQLLLSRGANPNVKAANEHPMHAACRGYHYASMKLLLEYNADIDVRDDSGKTALNCILDSVPHDGSPSPNGNVPELVQLLLERGADVNIASRYGKTLFYLACSMGVTSVVEKMLEYGAKVDGISDMKRPLCAACRNKHLPVVQLLLSYGANPNVLEAGEDRCRLVLPLHIAAADGNSELVKLLLKHGSNIDIADAHGSTAVHYSIENHDRATTSRYFHETRVASSTKSVVDILLENRADVNILNDSGVTPLYAAVSRGLLDVVRKMLQTCGGNPNISSSDKNPLVAACETRNVELVDMLLKNGADPNLASASCYPYSECRLPLCTAASFLDDSDEIIVLLMNAGASVNAIGREGKTASCIVIENIMNPRRYRSTECRPKKGISKLRLLLEHGADKNTLMPDGRLPLGLLVSAIGDSQRRECRTHFIELLQLMVKHGAILSDSFSLLGQSTSSRQFLQGTLRNLAAFDGHYEFIVDLFRAGAGFQLIAFCCNAVATRSPMRTRSIRLCQAAVIAGYSPSTAEMQQIQLAAASEYASGGLLKQLVNWLDEDRQKVPSLSRQCRVVIRQQLSLAVNHRSILTAIDTLPLPNSIKMYLQFEGRLTTEVDLSVSTELWDKETCVGNRHSACSESDGEPSGRARQAVAAVPAHPRRRPGFSIMGLRRTAGGSSTSRPQNAGQRHLSPSVCDSELGTELWDKQTCVGNRHSACSESDGEPSGGTREAVAAVPARRLRMPGSLMWLRRSAGGSSTSRPQNAGQRHLSPSVCDSELGTAGRLPYPSK